MPVVVFRWTFLKKQYQKKCFLFLKTAYRSWLGRDTSLRHGIGTLEKRLDKVKKAGLHTEQKYINGTCHST